VTSGKVAGRYDKQIAVFSQVANPIRDNGDTREFHPDNTLIFYKSKFHWAWFIPLTADTVSVGVVAPGAYFAGRKESKADYLRRELREINPDLARRVEGCELIEEARAIPNYSYHCRTFTGPGWMAIGDAHRFIDPIFSFGLFVTMREAQLAAPVIADYLGSTRRGTGNPFLAHETKLERGLDAVQDLIDGFWENPIGFAWLAHGERRKADIIDLFAGRIYGETPSPGLLDLRKMAEKGRALNPQRSAMAEAS
jgi:flavin-dependent dehydrogenase